MKETIERRKNREYDPIKFIDEIAAVSRVDGKMPDPEKAIGRECYAFSEQEDAAFEVAEKTAQQILHDLKKGEDYRVERDGVGNLYVRMLCGVPGAQAVMTGSHLDSVLEGGKYDGVAGVAVGLDILAGLVREKKQGGKFARDFVVAAFRSEESSPRNGMACVGSSIATGTMKDEDFKKLMYDKSKKISFRDHFIQRYKAEKYGQLVHEMHNPRIRKEDFAAYIEVHIEQSGVTAARGKDIGIVTEGIGGAHREEAKMALPPERVETERQAYRKITLTCLGIPDHTGGTPPNTAFYREKPEDVWYRKDALVAMCNVINKLLGHPSNGSAIKVLGSRPEKATGYTTVPSHQVTELLVPSSEMESVRKKLETLKKETEETLGVQMSYADEEFTKSSAEVVDSAIVRRMMNLPEIVSILATKEFGRQRSETGTTRATATDYVLSPNGVEYKVDFREVNIEDLKRLLEAVHAREDMTLGKGTYTKVSSKPHSPVDEKMVKKLIEYAKERKMSFVLMPSMAGQDADRMAAIGIPTVMVFIRQDDGISHNPREKMTAPHFYNATPVVRDFVLDMLREG